MKDLEAIFRVKNRKEFDKLFNILVKSKITFVFTKVPLGWLKARKKDMRKVLNEVSGELFSLTGSSEKKRREK